MAFFLKIVRRAPRRRPPQEMPPELENEGQHVQTVFPPDDALGGPGYFAFNPLAHMTEAHALATPASRARLEAEWGAHWDASKGVLLEKSPSNLLRARFLQALWPDCHFVFIVRHPLAHAYALDRTLPTKWRLEEVDTSMDYNETWNSSTPSKSPTIARSNFAGSVPASGPTR